MSDWSAGYSERGSEHYDRVLSYGLEGENYLRARELRGSRRVELRMKASSDTT